MAWVGTKNPPKKKKVGIERNNSWVGENRVCLFVHLKKKKKKKHKKKQAGQREVGR